MKRVLVPLALLAAAASASAQQDAPGRESIGIKIHIGYGVTPRFRTSTGRDDVSGPEIALAIPVGSLGGESLFLEPSFFGGGRIFNGSDKDEDVYRITLYAQHTFGNFGVRAGVGYSGSARARGGEFDGANDVIFDLGVEIPFRFNTLKGISPYVDVHNVFCSEKQLAGFFVGVGAKV